MRHWERKRKENRFKISITLTFSYDREKTIFQRASSIFVKIYSCRAVVAFIIKKYYNYYNAAEIQNRAYSLVVIFFFYNSHRLRRAHVSIIIYSYNSCHIYTLAIFYLVIHLDINAKSTPHAWQRKKRTSREIK